MKPSGAWLGTGWACEHLAFICPPSASGVQDSREWPELAPNTLLSGCGPDWRAVVQAQGKRKPALLGSRTCHVAGGVQGTCQGRSALSLHRPRSSILWHLQPHPGGVPA